MLMSRKNEQSEADILLTWLKGRKKEDLVKLITDRCAEDEDFHDQLQIVASAAQPSGGLDEIKRAIQQAYRIHGFIDWRGTYTYSRKLDQVTHTLRELLRAGRAEAVIELVEYAMKRWETAIQHIDDSNGCMGMVRDDLHELHLLACKQVGPDGKQLAERLFKICLTSEWEMFYTAYDDYAPVWGDAGKKRYRQLVEAEWQKLPRLKPGDDDSKCFGTAGWLSELMIRFAQEDGDFESELDIMQRDLSRVWNFSKLAERCAELGRLDQAVDWVEKGLRHFKNDRTLEEMRYEFYWKQRRYDEALVILWNLFEKFQSLETYKQLVVRAKERKQLDEWRPKALDTIRMSIASAKLKKERWSRSDHSLLVAIFLWEGDIETAWNEALSGDCSESLWLTLCAKREAGCPAECFPVYLRLAELRVQNANNDAYREAVQLIQKAKLLAAACGQIPVFAAGLEKIKTAHKPKRNFIKYLAESGL
jgi:tetratricopeptide (TPR) repeat protein